MSFSSKLINAWFKNPPVLLSGVFVRKWSLNLSNSFGSFRVFWNWCFPSPSLQSTLAVWHCVIINLHNVLGVFHLCVGSRPGREQEINTFKPALENDTWLETIKTRPLRDWWFQGKNWLWSVSAISVSSSWRHPWWGTPADPGDLLSDSGFNRLNWNDWPG